LKTPSAAYDNKENAIKRQPAELFHIYDSSSIDEYYTNGDVAVVYGGHTWNPAVIKREQIEYNSDLNNSQLTITVDYLNPVVFYYISYNPPRTVWVEVYKLHRDLPLETDILFVGVISQVEISGNSAKVLVSGFEGFFEKSVCPKRFQRQCQHQLGDSKCTIDLESYKYSLTCNSVSTDGLTLTMSGSTTENILVLGFIKNETDDWTESRMIVYNVGTSVKIRYPFGESIVGKACTLYYGCSGDITVCRDSFNNLDHFLGFPYIPIDNPARRLLV